MLSSFFKRPRVRKAKKNQPPCRRPQLFVEQLKAAIC